MNKKNQQHVGDRFYGIRDTLELGYLLDTIRYDTSELGGVSNVDFNYKEQIVVTVFGSDLLRPINLDYNETNIAEFFLEEDNLENVIINNIKYQLLGKAVISRNYESYQGENYLDLVNQLFEILVDGVEVDSLLLFSKPIVESSILFEDRLKDTVLELDINFEEDSKLDTSLEELIKDLNELKGTVQQNKLIERIKNTMDEREKKLREFFEKASEKTKESFEKTSEKLEETTEKSQKYYDENLREKQERMVIKFLEGADKISEFFSELKKEKEESTTPTEQPTETKEETEELKTMDIGELFEQLGDEMKKSLDKAKEEKITKGVLDDFKNGTHTSKEDLKMEDFDLTEKEIEELKEIKKVFKSTPLFKEYLEKSKEKVEQSKKTLHTKKEDFKLEETVDKVGESFGEFLSTVTKKSTEFIDFAKKQAEDKDLDKKFYDFKDKVKETFKDVTEVKLDTEDSLEKEHPNAEEVERLSKLEDKLYEVVHVAISSGNLKANSKYIIELLTEITCGKIQKGLIYSIGEYKIVLVDSVPTEFEISSLVRLDSGEYLIVG